MLNKKLIIILAISIVVSLVITAIIYNKLPDEIPMHLNAAGEVDRYGNKNAVFTSGTLPFLILLLMIAIPKFDKKKEQYEKNKVLYNILTGLITLFIITIHWISIFIAFGYDVNGRLAISAIIGILFSVIGGFIDKVKINNRIGIKLPTTLKDENNWNATHKLAHYTFIIGGILSVVSAFIRYKIGIVIFILSLVIAIVVPIFYSFIIYYKNKRSTI